jgi:hypothetical protein
MENLTAWGLVSATAAEREAVAEQIVDQAYLVLLIPSEKLGPVSSVGTEPAGVASGRDAGNRRGSARVVLRGVRSKRVVA